MSFEVLDVSPPALTSIEADEVLSFDVRGTDPFGLVTLAVKFPRSVTRELAFCSDPTLSTSFEEAYSGSTVESVVDGGYVRWRFTLRRNNIAFSPENPDEPQFKWPGTPTISIISEGGSTVVGPAGPTGPQGPRGSTGRSGRKGAQGKRGPAGRVTKERISFQRLLGNDSGGTYSAYPITVHQGLDWIVGEEFGFDGLDDAVLMGNVHQKERTNSWSVSVWVKTGEPAITGIGDFIICGNNDNTANNRGWCVYLHNDGQPHIQLSNGAANVLDVTGTDIGNTGQLTHFLFTYNGTSSPGGVVIYKNGVSLTLNTVLNSLSATIVAAGNVFRIGRFGAQATAFFPGVISYLSIWGSVLTAGNATTLFNNGVRGNEAAVGTPQSLWKLDGSDTTAANGVKDYGSSNFPGTTEGGLTNGVRQGTLLVRGATDWDTIATGAKGAPLLSTGPNTPPAYGLINLFAIESQLANTVIVNANAARSGLQALAVGTNTVLGRVAGNIVAAAIVNAQVDAAAGIQLSKLATQGANTVVVNATAGSAVPTALAIGTNAVLGRVAGNIVAAALVDAQITANTISNASRAQMAANTIKANATAGTANEADLSVGTNTVVGRVAGNIVAAALVNAQIATNTITAASQAQMTANTIKANPTAGTANESDLSVGTNSVVGRVAGNIVAAPLVDAQVDAAAAISLSKLANAAANTITGNWTAGSAAHTDNAVGTNTVVGRQGGNIVAAQLVDAQITTNTISNASRAQMATNTIKANATAGTANEADLAVGTNTVVGRVAGNIVAAALVDAQVDAAAAIALSKLANAAANTLTGNWTAGSAAHTDNSVGTNTVVGRVAGNIVAAALVNAQVDSAAAIVISKLADAASNTLMGNWTGSSGAHTDNSVGTNTVVGRVGGNIVAAALVDAQVSSTAAIALSKLADGGALSVVGRSANSSGAHADITAVAASDAVLRESGSTIGFGTIAAGGLSDAIISPIKLATLTSSVGAVFTIYASFAAGAGGSPDDVTVYNANAPFAFRILKTLPYVTTAVAASTLEARDTSGGGGAALSSLFDADVQTEDPAINTPISASTTVAANGSLFIRRSDSGIAGEMVFLCVRT